MARGATRPGAEGEWWDPAADRCGAWDAGWHPTGAGWGRPKGETIFGLAILLLLYK